MQYFIYILFARRMKGKSELISFDFCIVKPRNHGTWWWWRFSITCQLNPTLQNNLVFPYWIRLTKVYFAYNSIFFNSKKQQQESFGPDREGRGLTIEAQQTLSPCNFWAIGQFRYIKNSKLAHRFKGINKKYHTETRYK